MYAYGRRSRACLDTCDPGLVAVADRLSKWFNVSILYGERFHVEQNRLVAEGKSKARWPLSYHNTLTRAEMEECLRSGEYNERECELIRKLGPRPLSRAFDFAPYFSTPPHIFWGEEDQRDVEEFTLVAGAILQIGYELGVPLEWGGKWSKERMSMCGFNDRPHVQRRVE